MAHFVLVHGAWHGAWCWYRVIPLLRAAGHTVDALDLPSNGVDRTPTADVRFGDYVARVVRAIDDAPSPVILVGHSLGGKTISQAAEARPDRVAWLVYLAAMMLKDGESSWFLPGETLAVERALVPAPEGVATTVRRELVRELFYGLSPNEDVALAEACLVPQANVIAGAPVGLSLTNYGRVRRAYIECTRDNAIPIAIQRRMMEAQPPKRTFSMETDHSPFFSKPLDLARHLDSLT